MFKRNISCLLLLVFFSSCKSKTEQIDLIWEDVIHSKNKQEENLHIAELHDLISKKHISFEIYFVDSADKIRSIGVKQKNDSIKSIIIKFDIAKDKQLVKKGWKPIEIENCYYLFLE
jgi:hypothetical protein